MFKRYRVYNTRIQHLIWLLTWQLLSICTWMRMTEYTLWLQSNGPNQCVIVGVQGLENNGMDFQARISPNRIDIAGLALVADTRNVCYGDLHVFGRLVRAPLRPAFTQISKVQVYRCRLWILLPTDVSTTVEDRNDKGSSTQEQSKNSNEGVTKNILPR
jgi:hypothetical protein